MTQPVSPEDALKACRYFAFANSGMRCIGYGATITEARSNVVLVPCHGYEGDDDKLIDEVAVAMNTRLKDRGTD